LASSVSLADLAAVAAISRARARCSQVPPSMRPSRASSSVSRSPRLSSWPYRFRSGTDTAVASESQICCPQPTVPNVHSIDWMRALTRYNPFSCVSRVQIWAQTFFHELVAWSVSQCKNKGARHPTRAGRRSPPGKTLAPDLSLGAAAAVCTPSKSTRGPAVSLNLRLPGAASTPPPPPPSPLAAACLLAKRAATA
jgi:hypothetical protein